MNKKNSFMTVVALMSFFLINAGTTTINPAIQKIAEAFPNLPFTTILLVSTLPSLFAIPAAIVAGMLAGSKIRYKTLSVLGVLLFIAGGIAPAYSDNFTTILIERAAFGFAIGIIMPLGNAILIGLFEGQKRAAMLGLSNVFTNIGGVILQALGGYLAVFGWKYSFYGHALAIITLLLIIFFLPEPEKNSQPEGADKSKIAISASLWLIFLIYGAALVIFYPLIFNMSSILSVRGLGGSAIAAVVLSFFTIGGMIGGAAFSAIYKYTKRYIIATTLFIYAIGMAGIIYGGNIIIIATGMTLTGFAHFNLFPAIIMIISSKVPGNTVPISMSILMCTVNLAVFGSTYYTGLVGRLTGDVFVNPALIAMAIYALAAFIFLFINPFTKTKTEQEQ